MVKCVFSLIGILLLGQTINAQGNPPPEKKLVLTQRRAAEIALQNGPNAKETIYKYDGDLADKAENNVPLFLSTFDWKTTLESGYELDKSESFSVSDARFDKYQTKLSLDKNFLTGTKITASYLRLSQKSEYPFSSSNVSSEQTQDLVSVNLEQNLWRNAFGRADRAGLRAIEYAADSNQIMKVSDLQTVVLDAIRAFWKTYVAQENFKDSVAARDRYQKLVDSIKRKNGVGYAKPGEYAQVQAELETRIQITKKSSLDYLSEMDSLLTLLGLGANTELDLKISDELKMPPQFGNVDAESSRQVRAQKLLVNSSEEKLTAAHSQTGLGVSFVGKAGSGGVDRNANTSFAEMTGGSKTDYYVGLKLSYAFGSDSLNEEVKYKSMILQLNQTKLERTRSEQENALQKAERNVQTTYAVAQSVLREKEFRDKAVRELTNTYNQGRTDINTYIDALNNFFTTKTNYVQAIGDYQVALNELAAARDELIPEQNRNNK